MAITIDGVTYRNLQEQVGKNAQDIYELQGKVTKDEANISHAQTDISGINGLLNNVVAGIAPLNKVHVIGESNLEGPVTAGGPMEVDGDFTLNDPSNLKFKTGSLPASRLYRHSIMMSLRQSNSSDQLTLMGSIRFTITNYRAEAYSNIDDLRKDVATSVVASGVFKSSPNIGTYDCIVASYGYFANADRLVLLRFTNDGGIVQTTYYEASAGPTVRDNVLPL